MGSVAAIFKMADANFQCPISRRIMETGLVSYIRHHTPAQATILRHVESLVGSISEMGNPFVDPSGDLLVLDTIVVAECTIVESVQTRENIGQQRCDSVYQDRHYGPN